MQWSLAMRATGRGHIHCERSDQGNWYERQEHWPFEGDAQHEEDNRNRQTDGRYFQEDALPPLDDTKNIQFQVAGHCCRGWWLVSVLDLESAHEYGPLNHEPFVTVH